jgi:hypothetical protein
MYLWVYMIIWIWGGWRNTRGKWMDYGNNSRNLPCCCRLPVLQILYLQCFILQPNNRIQCSPRPSVLFPYVDDSEIESSRIKFYFVQLQLLLLLLSLLYFLEELITLRIILSIIRFWRHRHSLKILHCRHICICWLISNTSYRICVYICGLISIPNFTFK